MKRLLLKEIYREELFLCEQGGALNYQLMADEALDNPFFFKSLESGKLSFMDIARSFMRERGGEGYHFDLDSMTTALKMAWRGYKVREEMMAVGV